MKKFYENKIKAKRKAQMKKAFEKEFEKRMEEDSPSESEFYLKDLKTVLKNVKLEKNPYERPMVKMFDSDWSNWEYEHMQEIAYLKNEIAMEKKLKKLR